MNNYIGNDIVDLTTSDAIHFPTNLRFVRRVLAEEELEYFLRHNKSITLFWILWSAKEAVYKIIKKIAPASIFSHRAYVLNLQSMDHESAYGYVTYQDKIFHVAFTITPLMIHCIASPEGVSGHIISEVKALDKIPHPDTCMSKRELSSVHSGESYLVRCLLKNMLKDVTGNDYEIYREPLIKNYGPPEVWVDGDLCDCVDISMSHDGNYCAGLILFSEPST